MKPPLRCGPMANSTQRPTARVALDRAGRSISAANAVGHTAGNNRTGRGRGLQDCGFLVRRPGRFTRFPSPELHADLATGPQLSHCAENDGDSKEHENGEAEKNPHRIIIAFRGPQVIRRRPPTRAPHSAKNGSTGSMSNPVETLSSESRYSRVALCLIALPYAAPRHIGGFHGSH